KATGSRNCPAPFGLSTSALQGLLLGGSVNTGFLNISSITTEASAQGLTIDSTIDSAGAVFTNLAATRALGLEQTLGGVPPVNPAGSCIVESINSISTPKSATPPVSTELNAGTPLVLDGPGGKTANLNFASSGDNATLGTATGATSPFLAPGTW